MAALSASVRKVAGFSTHRVVRTQRRGGRAAVRVCASLTVRPYTIRKGDTLSSICKKRGLEVEQVVELNPELNPDLIIAGKTILLPAGKLSERDMEIVGGIRAGTYRQYPVREGETLEDIMEKRGITLPEMEELNPDTDLSSVKANQVLRLPSSKFTVREQEMLTGSGIIPREFFATATVIPSVVCGMVLGAAGAYWYFTSKAAKDDDEEEKPTPRF